MTALMGLGHRLRLARVALRLDAGDDLVERARHAYAAGAGLVVVRAPEPGIADLEAVRDLAPTPSLLGVQASDDVIERFGADLVLVPAGGSLRHAARTAHDFALVGRESDEVGGGDFGWLTAGADLGTAVDAAPPADPASVPWFAPADGADLDDVIAAGARRVWTTVADAVGPCATALREAWAADPAMEHYRFASAGLPERRVR